MATKGASRGWGSKDGGQRLDEAQTNEEHVDWHGVKGFTRRKASSYEAAAATMVLSEACIGLKSGRARSRVTHGWGAALTTEDWIRGRKRREAAGPVLPGRAAGAPVHGPREADEGTGSGRRDRARRWTRATEASASHRRCAHGEAGCSTSWSPERQRAAGGTAEARRAREENGTSDGARPRDSDGRLVAQHNGAGGRDDAGP
ncbi:hypothetical protein CDD83_3163 [Cordyceps sp. RAO-2017]|nr:hypothetical protein CDD83_3163 [Cordyceps sp. RAO-2017]